MTDDLEQDDLQERLKDIERWLTSEKGATLVEHLLGEEPLGCVQSYELLEKVQRAQRELDMAAKLLHARVKNCLASGVVTFAPGDVDVVMI